MSHRSYRMEVRGKWGGGGGRNPSSIRQELQDGGEGEVERGKWERITIPTA